jgi:hypothetical protein
VRKSSRSILATIVAAALIGLWPTGALAGCSGSTSTHLAIGVAGTTPGSGASVYGHKLNVWVNNFDSSQYNTWRSIVLLRSSSFSLEVGWTLNENDAGDQKAHVYRRWVNDGVVRHTHWYGQEVSPRDDYHAAAVKDPNHDKDWTFLFDNDAYGDDEYVNISGTQGVFISEAESWCSTDSLWAHFKDIKFLRGDGAWIDPGTLSGYTNNTPNYSLCIAPSLTAYHVKQNCS